MSASRLSRVQMATALVPLGLLSTAWTASLLAPSEVASVSAAAETPSGLPDGTSVPDQAIEAPASVTTDGVVAPSVPTGTEGKVIRTAATNGIPSAALAAYQRAEAVINAADATCHLDWQLLAAIGRVESDHGRYGGNTLDSNGIARPGIYGIALNGKNNSVPTRAIPDTDAGQHDNDTKWDRAVGPMQFIPSTWSVVGVDADGDGTRDPQNINDAALAAAVYLCSGNDDLSTDAGRRTAVHRYNNSDAYVDLVLSIADAYSSGDFTAVPNTTTSASMFSPSEQIPATFSKQKKTRVQQTRPGTKTPADRGRTDTATTPEPSPTPSEPGTPAPEESAEETRDKVRKDIKQRAEKTEKAVKDTVDTATKPVVEVLSLVEARTICKANLNIPLIGSLADLALTRCANQLQGETKASALSQVSGILRTILGGLGIRL